MSQSCREIHLKKYPKGVPSLDCFEIVTTTLPELKEGEVLVENIFMSVDPYMRGRMINRETYIPPFKVGEVLDGGCVGRVIDSKNDDVAKGTMVFHGSGWRDYSITSIGELQVLPDDDSVPLHYYLGILGMPGLTAYGGLIKIGQPKPGNTVLVSAAAGAVGSTVCQLAKIMDCKVVAIAGSEDKCNWLKNDLKVDAVINYKKEDNIESALLQCCPDGVDVYFDNVGGEILNSAFAVMKDFGRIVMCGMIDQYNAETPAPGPSNLVYTVFKRLRLQGFIVTDFQDLKSNFYRDLTNWIEDGSIQVKETIVKGLDNAPQAFLGLFDGNNLGKMIVEI